MVFRQFINYLGLFFLCLNIAFATDASSGGSVQRGAASLDSVYLLSTGDKILIEVYGEEDLRKEALLSDTGKISYPFLGEVLVKGLTTKQLTDLITEKLKGPFLLDPKVTVSILEYRPFFINGEIDKPGGYPFQPGLTLRKAIALAGGATEQAFIDEAAIIRESNPNKVPEKMTLDTHVLPGDIITVAEYRQVFVNGEVKKPGAYPFQKDLTFRKAIALAGGFSDRAARDKVLVIQEIKNNKISRRVKLEDIVNPGDIITVNQSFF